MESTTTTVWVAGCALALLIGAVIGYQAGARQAKRRRRELQQALNAQSVDLLDVRSENRSLNRFLGAAHRKDRLLKLTLTKLKNCNQEIADLNNELSDVERKHFIELSRLNMTAVESDQKAKYADEIARDANFKLRLLEKALPQLQTITAPEPKSYGQGEAVTVSVVDRHNPSTQHEQANKVSNRDIHRLTGLRSSNEKLRDRPDNTVTLHASPKVDQKETMPVQADQSLDKKTPVTRAT